MRRWRPNRTCAVGRSLGDPVAADAAAAPGTFSTVTVTFQASWNFCANIRAVMSVALPAVKPTIKRIGLSGYDDCPAAGDAISDDRTAPQARLIPSSCLFLPAFADYCAALMPASLMTLPHIGASVLTMSRNSRRRVADKLKAEAFELGAHVRLRHRLDGLVVNPVDDRPRQTRPAPSARTRRWLHSPESPAPPWSAARGFAANACVR